MKCLNRDFGDYLFYLSLTIFVSLTFSVNIKPTADVLLPLSYVALALLAMALFFRIRQYRSTEVFVLFGLGAVGVYQFVYNGDSSLMKIVLLLAAVKGIPLSRCIRYDLILRVMWILALILFSQVGLAEDMITSDSARGVRHSLGFSNANQLGMAVLIVCLEALYLMDFRVKPASVVLFIAIAVWLDTVSGSRSSTTFILLALAFAVCNTIWPRRILDSALLFRMGEFAVPVLFVLTWTALGFYQHGTPWAVEINEMMTNRIEHIDTYARLFSPQFFGSDLSNAGLTLDTLYAYLVYGYGLIITVIYLIINPLLIKRLYNYGERSMMLIFLLLSLYGLSERLWVCVEYNALMLAFAALLYGDRYKLVNNRELTG